MHYKKHSFLDAPIDNQTRHHLEKLLKENLYAFAEDERKIGTASLIEMPIDTGNHPPIAKRPYALALKHYYWVREEIDKLPEVSVMRESHSS